MIYFCFSMLLSDFAVPRAYIDIKFPCDTEKPKYIVPRLFNGKLVTFLKAIIILKIENFLYVVDFLQYGKKDIIEAPCFVTVCFAHISYVLNLAQKF